MEVYYISAGQTSLLQVQCEFYIGRVLCSILPEIHCQMVLRISVCRCITQSFSLRDDVALFLKLTAQSGVQRRQIVDQTCR